MADYYVENFDIITEEGEHYEPQVKDPEAVAMEEGETADTIVTYEKSEGDSISSFTDFINNFVSGTKIGRWFKNFYAGCQYILHVGSLVNNCVTDNADLPLSAAQGKVLMDELTTLKSDLSESVGTHVRPVYWNNGKPVAARFKIFGSYLNSEQSTYTCSNDGDYSQTFVMTGRGNAEAAMTMALIDQWRSVNYFVHGSGIDITVSDSGVVTISKNNDAYGMAIAIFVIQYTNIYDGWT